MNQQQSTTFYKKRVGDYELCDVLGEGSFATVRRAKHIKSGLEFAVKCLDKQSVEKQKMGKQLKREASSHLFVSFSHACQSCYLLQWLMFIWYSLDSRLE